MQILNEILEKIEKYETIIIHGHQRPDGDCYGAQFGLKDILKTSFPNKDIYVVGEVSDYVSFVGSPDIIEDSLYEGALSIVVDTATESRISDKRYSLGSEVIKIDHHIPVDQYGDLIWVDTTFPSCAQMIAYFYKTFENELKMTEIGARAMYTGIVTDTGRFRYRGVSKLTHEIAGLLIEKGADVVEIDNKLSKESLGVFKFKAELLNNAIFDEGFVYGIIRAENVEKHNISMEDAAATVNLFGGIEGYNVWFVAVEYPNEIRLRIRSSGLEIDKLANLFEGGGHKMASGARLNSFDELDNFVNEMRAYIKRYQ